MVEWNIRDLQKRRGANRKMTPEIAKIMADVVLRKVWELNAVADDHLPDDGLDFMEPQPTLKMRMIARSICFSVQTAADIIMMGHCEPFAIASCLESARNDLRNYSAILARGKIGVSRPLLQKYEALYEDLARLIWEVNRGKVGYFSRCQCVRL
jgi:hypothetical protein